MMNEFCYGVQGFFFGSRGDVSDRRFCPLLLPLVNFLLCPVLSSSFSILKPEGAFKTCHRMDQKQPHAFAAVSSHPSQVALNLGRRQAPAEGFVELGFSHHASYAETL